MSLEKDIAMMVMLKKVKEMNMVNVVQNQDSFYQTLNMELKNWQQKLQHHIGMCYVPNFTSSIPATDYVYAYLDKNQELVISSIDLYPDDSELYDEESNFGKCKLNDEYVQIWYKKRKHIQTVLFQGIIKPTTCQKWFSDCENLTEIKNMKNLDTSECTDMSYMFYDCKSLTTLDVRNFDTSKVTDISYMFFNCISLTTLDLRNFNTGKVTNMSGMFYNCESLTTLDVRNFDTSKVTDMSKMFKYCGSLTTLDLSNFDTSKVTDMANMFNGCYSLTTLYLSSFDTSNVTNMSYMFCECKSLHLNCSLLDVSNVEKHKNFNKHATNVLSPTWTIV